MPRLTNNPCLIILKSLKPVCFGTTHFLNYFLSILHAFVTLVGFVAVIEYELS